MCGCAQQVALKFLSCFWRSWITRSQPPRNAHVDVTGK